MTSASKTDEAKPFLGAQIDFQFRDTLLQDATKASFFIRLMAETLYRRNGCASLPTTHVLFREVIQEIAPERVADFNRYVAGRAA